MDINQLEEKARNLRIASLIYWDRGEVEASDVMRDQARRLEQQVRDMTQ